MFQGEADQFTVDPHASMALRIVNGPLESDTASRDRSRAVDLDDWGAGLLWGKYMAGVSRAGRVFVCADWRRAMTRHAPPYVDAEPGGGEHAEFIIELMPNASRQFDLGGWLSLRDNRLLVEVRESIYVIALDHKGAPRNPSFAIPTSNRWTTTANQPVSFMGLYDYCLMSTHTYVSLPRYHA